jgi:hypothetical protein
MFEKKESLVFVGEDEERRRKQQRGLVRAAYQPQPTPSLVFKPEFSCPLRARYPALEYAYTPTG